MTKKEVFSYIGDVLYASTDKIKDTELFYIAKELVVAFKYIQKNGGIEND